MAKKETAQPEAPRSYVTLQRPATVEYVEKKSVFLGHAAPVRSQEEALAFLAEKRKKYSDATHNVYAYLLEGGNVTRYSDDGEPQGTAGIPVLDVIRKRGFCDAVIVVTRYFGGILLGAGGLVRAYTAAASLAVEEAHVVTYEEFTAFTLRCDYTDYQKVANELPAFAVKQDDIAFESDVTLRLAIRTPLYADFSRRICDLTAGRVTPVVVGTRFDA